MPTTTPSYDDVRTAFARIRTEGGVQWDYEHPLRDFELAAQAADITRDAERLAAYRLAGATPPRSYYDCALDALHLAIERLERQRRLDHSEAPVALRVARSAAMREQLAATDDSTESRA